jgi:hypothetical protein
MNEIAFSLIEIFISLVVETIILGGMFNWLSSKTVERAERKLKTELKIIENQNTLIYQEFVRNLYSCRDDILAEIKENS